ncbi:MAG: hypothetical protein AB9836_01560 [Aminipila sp.]
MAYGKIDSENRLASACLLTVQGNGKGKLPVCMNKGSRPDWIA